jgi:hypothetical protein
VSSDARIVTVTSIDVAAFLISKGYKPIQTRTLPDGVVAWDFSASPEVYAILRSWREQTGECVPTLRAFSEVRKALSRQLRQIKGAAS